MSFCFCFESNGSIDTMIKVPPTTQKVPFISHKIKSVGKDVLSGWVVQHVVEFIHADRFDWWEFDFWNRIQLFFGVGC